MYHEDFVLLAVKGGKAMITQSQCHQVEANRSVVSGSEGCFRGIKWNIKAGRESE